MYATVWMWMCVLNHRSHMFLRTRNFGPFLFNAAWCDAFFPKTIIPKRTRIRCERYHTSEFAHFLADFIFNITPINYLAWWLLPSFGECVFTSTICLAFATHKLMMITMRFNWKNKIEQQPNRKRNQSTTWNL